MRQGRKGPLCLAKEGEDSDGTTEICHPKPWHQPDVICGQGIGAALVLQHPYIKGYSALWSQFMY